MIEALHVIELHVLILPPLWSPGIRFCGDLSGWKFQLDLDTDIQIYTYDMCTDPDPQFLALERSFEIGQECLVFLCADLATLATSIISCSRMVWHSGRLPGYAGCPGNQPVKLCLLLLLQLLQLLLMFSCAGIFIGSMITRLGSRIVCITGSITGLVGFALGSFATSIIQMYLAIGITAGLFVCLHI